MPVEFYRAMAHVDDTSYILSDEFRIVRVNAAWNRFAEANNGHEMLARWGRGANVLDAISGDLRESFRAMFERALNTNEKVEHDYECNSPTINRTCRMFAIPIDGQFLVVTHAVRLEGDARALIEENYQHDGVVVACAGCRRVRSLNKGERWDWVAGYLDLFLDNISHGSCSLCATLAMLPLR